MDAELLEKIMGLAARKDRFTYDLRGDCLVIAENEHAGLELLRWHLPDAGTIVVPESNSAVRRFLEERHYTIQERYLRLHLGKALSAHADMIYAHP